MHIIHAKLAAAAVLSAALGFGLAAWLLQPVMLPAQAAILKEYLAIYCHASKPSSDDRRFFMAGEAAALSKVTIAAGLGAIALVENQKCKMGL